MQKEKRIVRVNERGLRVGEDHQNAILTDAEVDMVRALHEQGLSYKVLAEKFGIGKTTVADIIKCRRRAQIPVASRVVFFDQEGKPVTKDKFAMPVRVPEK